MVDLNNEAERAARMTTFLDELTQQLKEVGLDDRACALVLLALSQTRVPNAGTAPSAPMGEELPAMPSNVVQVTRRIRRCESDTPAQVVLEHFAIEYARKVVAPYAERIRQLERLQNVHNVSKNVQSGDGQVEHELAARKTESIDTPGALAWAALAENGNVIIWSRRRSEVEPVAAKYDRPVVPVIAYIDGRTAGGVPEGWHIERGDDVIRVSSRNEGFATLRKDGDDPRETVLYRYFDQLATKEA
jgi:hypothetical protein